MTMSSMSRRRARYLVPIAAAAVAVGVVFIPQAASGAQHPTLPARTAAQLLASLEQASVPQFSGTTVETARLGLPSLPDGEVGGISTGDGSPLEQVVTLLTGSHTAQIAYGGPDKQRVAIFLSDLSETDIVHNGTNLWTYSSDSNSVSHSVVKPDSGESQAPDDSTPVDPTKAAEHALAEINPSTKVTVDRTAEVAGRPAYQLDLYPRDNRSLISSIRIALDSKTSLPLRVQVWSRKNVTTPAFEVGFTSISMSPPSASTFDFSKPPTATTESSPLGESTNSVLHGSADTSRTAGGDHSTTVGKDWLSVYVDKLATTTSADGVTSVGPQPQIERCINNVCTKAPAGTAPPAGAPAAPDLTQSLDQLGTRVSGGHLITTSLVSILITDDNRLLVGAVTPQYLEQVAASGAAK